MTNPPTDDTPERTRGQRLAELAEELCHSYTYGVGLAEMTQTDPEEAKAHLHAATHLLPWIEKAPKQQVRDAFIRGYDKGRTRERTNPPGSTMEQLPDDVLALLAHRTYLSTACETARLLDGAIINHPERDDLPGHRDRLHERCRLRNKFTGRPCICPCHRGGAAEQALEGSAVNDGA